MAIKSARGLDFGGLLLLLQRGQHIEKICQSCIPNTSLDRGHDVFVALVERVVCLGHFFRLRTEGGTLQRPDGKICQANRAEILLLWVMTLCRNHAEYMKGKPSTLAHPPPEPLLFFLVSFLLPFSPNKACKLQCT